MIDKRLVSCFQISNISAAVNAEYTVSTSINYFYSNKDPSAVIKTNILIIVQSSKEDCETQPIAVDMIEIIAKHLLYTNDKPSVVEDENNIPIIVIQPRRVQGTQPTTILWEGVAEIVAETTSNQPYRIKIKIPSNLQLAKKNTWKLSLQYKNGKIVLKKIIPYLID